MAAEDLPREDHNQKDITEEHSFDVLAKGLASGSVSRRQALKLVGGALLGGVLASIPGLAWAHHQPDHGLPPGQGGTPPGQGGAPPGQGSPPPAACTPGDDICAVSVCGPPDEFCSCVPTVEGTAACVVPFCGPPCTTNTDCPDGTVCGAVEECCEGLRACVAPCGTTPPLAASSNWGA